MKRYQLRLCSVIEVIKIEGISIMRLGDNWLEKFMMIFGFFMVALYIGLGVTFMFIPVFTYVPKEIRVIFGFFFLMYGTFRLVRLLQKVKENNN
jgi:uncharacterized membrane protein SirB2